MELACDRRWYSGHQYQHRLRLRQYSRLYGCIRDGTLDIFIVRIYRKYVGLDRRPLPRAWRPSKHRHRPRHTCRSHTGDLAHRHRLRTQHALQLQSTQRTKCLRRLAANRNRILARCRLATKRPSPMDSEWPVRRPRLLLVRRWRPILPHGFGPEHRRRLQSLPLRCRILDFLPRRGEHVL